MKKRVVLLAFVSVFLLSLTLLSSVVITDTDVVRTLDNDQKSIVASSDVKWRELGASGGLTVTPEADRVTVENPLVQIVISTSGVRPIKWTTATGLELAADAQPAGAIGKRYPLWDWIPAQMWPGELSTGNYSYEIVESNETVATIRFNYTCSQSPLAGLQVVKVLTFYADKYYFDMEVILRNPTGSSISTKAPWDARVGYNINAVGYLRPLSYLYQGYQDGGTPYLDLNLGWNRKDAKELKWIAVYNVGTGAIIALAISNATSTVWFEGGRGAWGSETRVEYPPVTIAPGSQVAYVLQVYGGPPDFEQLSEVGMVNLVRGISQIILHPVIWDGITYYIVTFSNSTVSDFSFSMPDKKITFNVTGPDATNGYCNATIPKALIRANATHPWTVLVGGSPVSPTVVENGAYTFLYFTYAHSTQKVEIIGSMGPLPPKVIRVPEDYLTIQAAVNAANLGDVINVSSRTYYENVIVDKSYLTLVGEERSTTIIDGNGAGNVISITSGIWGIPTNGVNISGLTIQNAHTGIYLYSSNGTTISGNTVMNNGYEGIGLYESDSCSLIGNTILNNWISIYFINSGGCTLRDNNMTGNSYNFGAIFGSLKSFTHDIDTSNTVNGKPIYYWVNQHDKQIPADAGFVGIVNSTNIVVKDLNLTRNARGVLFVNTNNSTISGNNLTNNAVGIEFHWSSGCTLSGNTVTNNVWGGGIGLSYSNSCILSGNTISNNNYYGMGIFNSNNNKVYHNNFINNTEQVSLDESSDNAWDFNGEGNYWSDYNGTDLDQDGIGNTPYTIDENNQDNYPLMGMFSNFTISWEEETYYLTTISNSTISNFQFNASQRTISFNVTGPDHTPGFCRITIPNILVQELWKGNYTVLVDGKEVTFRNWTDGTNTYLYFTYMHSEHKVTIVPEFPSALVLPLVIIVTLVAVVLGKTIRTKKGKNSLVSYTP